MEAETLALAHEIDFSFFGLFARATLIVKIVMIMLIAGAMTWFQARKLLGTRLVTHDPADPEPDPQVARRHRIAGRTAVINAVLGFLMAILVLAGMFARLLP